MVISEKSSFLDPLVMNSSTTTGGRWCPPASNAEAFMSSSPSYCVNAASPGMWGGQGNDITSQLERRDWMRKNLTGSSIKDTTSSPASLWGTSFSSSQNPGSTRSSFFGGGSSGQSSGVGGGGQGGSMWTSGSSNRGGGHQASSGWSSRGIGSSEQQCSSSNWSSSSRGYRTDRLMQMD